MKKYIIIICLTIISTELTYSQRLSEIDTLKYETMIDKKFGKNFKTGMDIKIYFANDKNSYRVGDTLVLGMPSGINTTKTLDGYDTRYEYIFYGKPAAVLLKGMRYVEGTYKDYKVTIDKIQFNKGSMGLENYVFFYVKPLPNTDFTLIDDLITVTMVDSAISKGEITALNYDRPMTRDDAINILKKKKEELDLEIITKEEYDNIKNKLIPIIKQ